MNTLSARQRAAITVTFFSMFFGAGNLIFPPFMGALSGQNTPLATIGFIVSAVGLPVLGVLAVTKAGGFEILAGTIGKRFAAILAMAIMLTIGPFFAIPRTATTSFEMAITPLLSHDAASTSAVMQSGTYRWSLLIYTAVFFAIAWLLAQHPGKLSQILGKITGPVLLLLIAALTVYTAITLHVSVGPAVAPYNGGAVHALTQGFIDGYQTMDLLAALYFGIIIGANIRAMGISDAKAVQRYTAQAGLGTGILIAIVYIVLAAMGAVAGSLAHIDAHTDTGATVLTVLTRAIFGQYGTLLVGLIFIIACLNVCTGLISTCSSFMANRIPRLGSRSRGISMGYRTWSIVFTLFALLVANAGLSTIIKVSIPVLIALYPIAIVLVGIGLAHHTIAVYLPKLPLWLVIPVAVVSIVDCVARLLSLITLPEGWLQSALTLLTHWLQTILAILPGYDYQLGWIVPAVLALLCGIVHSLAARHPHPHPHPHQAA